MFRAKGLALEAPWTIVTDNLSLVDTNEFAVVWGDHHSFAADFVPRPIAAGKFNSIVIKRDAAFKEYYIGWVHGVTLADDFAKLKQLMADQGLLILDDVTNYTVA